MASRFSTRFLRRHLHRHFTTTKTPIPKPFSPSHLNPKPTSNLHPNPQTPISRHFSTRHPRSPKPSISSRARALQTRRLWTYALAFSFTAGFIIIVLYQFEDQLVFYITPTQALEQYTSDPSKTKFRLGGLVLDDSVNHIPSSSGVQFVVTDLITDILVKCDGKLPDLFREGHSVVVEGFVKKFEQGDEVKGVVEENEDGVESRAFQVSEKARSLGCYFDAVNVLAKHDEKYMPPEVANAIEKNRKLIKEKEDALVKENGGSVAKKEEKKDEGATKAAKGSCSV